MNKRTALWAIGIIFVIICLKTQFVSLMFAFFVMGIIPGTDWAIPAWLMLVTYPLGFFLIIRWLTLQTPVLATQSTTVAKPAAKGKSSKTSMKKRTPANRRSTKKRATSQTTRRRYRSV